MAKKTEAVKHAVEHTFTEKVREIFSEKLVSILLYGSYVSDNYVQNVSDINVLIIINTSDYGKLNEFGKQTHKLLRKYNITPLILRRQEFLNSADVFPMEYMDITSRYRVLYGDDITRELHLTRNNLRHQLEYQLRGNVNSLRQMITASKGKKRVLGKNISRWYGSFSALFRGLLRLSGLEDIPSRGEEVLTTIKDRLGVDTQPFVNLLDYRNGGTYDVDTLAEEVLYALQDLVSNIDSMDLEQ